MARVVRTPQNRDMAPTAADIDDLLELLPRLRELGGEYVVEWRIEAAKGQRARRFPIYPLAVTEFFYVASRACWIDARHDGAAAAAMLADRDAVARADMAAIKAMLTWCVRGEQFHDGHWNDVLGDGRVFALLERLDQIRSTEARRVTASRRPTRRR